MNRFIAASLTDAQRLASRTGARSRLCVLRKNVARTLPVYSPAYGLVRFCPAQEREIGHGPVPHKVGCEAERAPS